MPPSIYFLFTWNSNFGSTQHRIFTTKQKLLHSFSIYLHVISCSKHIQKKNWIIKSYLHVLLFSACTRCVSATIDIIIVHAMNKNVHPILPLFGGPGPHDVGPILISYCINDLFFLHIFLFFKFISTINNINKKQHFFISPK